MEKTILGEKIEGQGKTQAPCVLITGFEPFGGETVNPSWQAVERLPEQIRGRKVEKLLLPVTYGSSAQKLLEEIRRLEPEMVLCVGQAGGRAAVTVERTGINWAEASLADNDGYTALGETLEASGWDGYFSTLPLNPIVEAIRKKGIPAQISESAGTYVCNQLLYRLLHFLRESDRKILGGFIHIPFSPEQVAEKKGGAPSLPVELSAMALEAAVEATLETAL